MIMGTCPHCGCEAGQPASQHKPVMHVRNDSADGRAVEAAQAAMRAAHEAGYSVCPVPEDGREHTYGGTCQACTGYTHIVRRASGYIAGWFRGEPPQQFIDDCNREVPGDPAHAEVIPEWPTGTGACWNAFCTAGDCDGLHHVDATGHSWAQRRGTIYCPACGGYFHQAGDCPRGYSQPVATVYERGPLGDEQIAGALATKVESRPMKPGELGQYVCVAQGGCLQSPHTTITSDGIWVKTGQQWSSAHRDCVYWRGRKGKA